MEKNNSIYTKTEFEELLNSVNLKMENIHHIANDIKEKTHLIKRIGVSYNAGYYSSDEAGELTRRSAQDIKIMCQSIIRILTTTD